MDIMMEMDMIYKRAIWMIFFMMCLKKKAELAKKQLQKYPDLYVEIGEMSIK